MREGSAKEEEEGCGGQEHRICFKYHITSGEEVFCENETKANSVSDKLKVTKSISGPAGIVQQTQWYAGKCLTVSSLKRMKKQGFVAFSQFHFPHENTSV